MEGVPYLRVRTAREAEGVVAFKNKNSPCGVTDGDLVGTRCSVGEFCTSKHIDDELETSEFINYHHFIIQISKNTLFPFHFFNRANTTQV